MHRKMQQNDDVENRTLSNEKGQTERCELSQYDTFQLIAGWNILSSLARDDHSLE